MKPINWHRSIPPISITGDPEPDFKRTVATNTVRLPDYVKPAEHKHVPAEPTEPDPLQKFFENYMNSSQLPRPIVEVRVGSGPQSVTNLLQYLYTKRLLCRPSQATARQPTNRVTRSLLPRRITTDVAHRRKPPAQYLQSPFDFGDFGCKTHPQQILNVHQSFH
jgi:hypothetical protein